MQRELISVAAIALTFILFEGCIRGALQGRSVPSNHKLVIGLPGRNPQTYHWMKALLQEGVPQFDQRIWSYRHWADADIEANVAAEADSLGNTQGVLVVAKSFGTLVLLHAFEHLHFRAGRAILIGFPLLHAGKAEREALVAFVEQTPTMLIQQSQDFAGPFAEVNALIAGEARTIEIAGSDHEYSDLDQIATHIRQFVHG